MPSHYLNEWWFIINWTLENKFQWNLNKNTTIFILENEFENVVCKMMAFFASLGVLTYCLSHRGGDYRSTREATCDCLAYLIASSLVNCKLDCCTLPTLVLSIGDMIMWPSFGNIACNVVWLASWNIDLGMSTSSVHLVKRQEFQPFPRGHWQSLAQPLHQTNCLLSGLGRETGKRSI